MAPWKDHDRLFPPDWLLGTWEGTPLPFGKPVMNLCDVWGNSSLYNPFCLNRRCTLCVCVPWSLHLLSHVALLSREQPPPSPIIPSLTLSSSPCRQRCCFTYAGLEDEVQPPTRLGLGHATLHNGPSLKSIVPQPLSAVLESSVLGPVLVRAFLWL